MQFTAKAGKVEMEEQTQQELVAPQQEAQPQETVAPPVLSQDQVNRIVAREKQKAEQKAEERYKRELEALRGSQQQHNEQVPREVDADAIYKQVQERFEKEMQERQLKEHMNEVANNYLNKVNAAKDSYEDFEETIKNFDPSEFPKLTYLLSGMENAGHVLYDLSKNPMKIASLDRLAEKTPRLAQAELQKLSLSISQNEKAKAEAEQQQVLDPLSRLQPSRVSGNNGKMGVRDLRGMDWLRG